VNVELRSDQPVVRSFTNPDLSAIRVRIAVQALQKTNTTNGDIEGYSVGYAIDVATDGSAFNTVISNAFTGKTTTLYERSHRVDLPEGSQWQIRVRRLTPNANSATIADTTLVQSMTEIIDAKLRYPNCAL
ncbi:MAG: host specificity protein J, partial [Xanthomonas perforans]|nr:host specificity protein J [Xanthomonas perforans]